MASYLFSPDDQILFFRDSHGTTRFERPKKLKTDRTIQGGMVQDVNMASGTEIPRHDLPDEAPVLDAIDLWATRDVGHYRPNSHPRGAYDLASGFTAEFGCPDWHWELAFGAHYNQTRWRLPLNFHGGHHHDFFPHASGLVVTKHSPRDRVGFAAFFDMAGALTETFEAAALSAPQFCVGRLAWQRDEDTVVLRDAEGAEQAFSIKAVTAKAHTAKKHPRSIGKSGNWLGDLDNAGAGTVALGRTALSFVPWHGETFLDLVEETEVHRKLPEVEHALRRNFRERAQRAARFCADADMLFVGSGLELKKKRRNFFYGIESTLGDGGLTGVCVSSAAAALFSEDPDAKAVDGWTYSGMSGGGHDYMNGTAGEDELLRIFKIFDDHAVHLHWALWSVRSVYERRLKSEWGSSYYNEILGPVMTRPAEKLLMQAFLESAADAPRYGGEAKAPSFKLLDRVDAWRSAELDESAYLERAKEVQHSNIDEDFFKNLARAYFHDGPWTTSDD